MKRLFLLALVLPLHAAPTDEELLAFVRDRGKAERVTPKPFDMDRATATRCNIDAVLSAGKDHGGSLFHVFANEPAAIPIFDPWGKFPEGSILLKEKISREDGKTTLFTGMLKREKGYNPRVGDWEFFTLDGAAAKITERGKMERCAGCHVEFPKGDYITRYNYIQPAQLSGGRIVLHSSGAKAHGEKLHYEEQENKNTLGFWVNPADRASWDFEVIHPGTYAIHIWQGCGKGSGDSEVEIKCAGQSRRFKVEETGHFQNFKERVIGKVSFDKAGSQTLEVRALSKPGVAVMDLRQVVLVPVRE
jgi:hypothetical protein